MAYCRNCGTQLAEDVKFCPNCGTPVEPSGKEGQNAGENRNHQSAGETYTENRYRQSGGSRDNTGYYDSGRNETYGGSGYDNYSTPNMQQTAAGGEIPGKKEATRSMVLGIIGVVLLFFGFTSIVSFILGIIGLVQASHAKQAGCMDGYRTAGFVLSLISTVGGAVVFVIVLVVLIFLGVAFGLGMSEFSHVDGIHDMMLFMRTYL